MQNIEKVKEILYSEGDGIFWRLRDGDYSISEDEKNTMISFAKDCNVQLRQGSLETEAVAILLESVEAFLQKDEEEWPKLLVGDMMREVYNEIEYGD